MNHAPPRVARLALAGLAGGLALVGAAGPRASAQPTAPVAPATFPATTPTGDVVWPSEPPDAQRGLAVFAEHCAGCHGPFGRGDGELVDRLPAPPPDLSLAARGLFASPADDFETVTEGRIDRLMPPFAASLSDAERWDAVVALRAFRETPHALVRGEAIWQSRCAACHGDAPTPMDGAATATTDGNAERAVTDMTRLALLGALADDEVLAHLLGPGAGPDGSRIAAPAALGAARDAHQAAFESLEARARADLLAHSRAFAYRALHTTGLAAGAALRGTVANLTAGASPVAGGLVVLQAVGGIVPEPPLTATVAAGGGFAFDGLVAGDDVVYRAAVVHEGATFDAARPLTMTGASEALDVGVLAVWDADSGLVLDAPVLHSVAAPIAERGVLEIVERWVLSNETDRAATGVRLALPDGARNVRFADDRLAGARIEDGAIHHPLALPPGEHEVILVYDVPYAADSATLARPLLQSVADASLTVVDPAVTVASSALAASEDVTIGRAAGRRYRFAALAAGEQLVATLEGLPGSGAGAQDVVGARAPSPVAPDMLTWVALGASALGLAAVARFARAARAGAATRRSLALSALRAAATALERARAAGDLAPNDYAVRRARLVERALRLMPYGPDAAGPAGDSQSPGDAPGPGDGSAAGVEASHLPGAVHADRAGSPSGSEGALPPSDVAPDHDPGDAP